MSKEMWDTKKILFDLAVNLEVLTRTVHHLAVISDLLPAKEVALLEEVRANVVEIADILNPEA